jgi:hypothetical protein
MGREDGLAGGELCLPGEMIGATMSARVPFTAPLPAPSAPVPSGTDVVAGPLIPPIDHLKLYDGERWEQFVLEWADALRAEYEAIEQHGGAGDLGCDVVAYLRGGAGAWANYRCKHYDHRLTPSDIWVEIAKLIVHTQRGTLTVPRRYVFVAPQGAGTKLAKLLRKPDELRVGLLAAWDKNCRTRVTSGAPIELDGALRAYIDAFDFSVFSALPPLRLIEEHAQTRWHVARFGSGLPARPPAAAPPPAPVPTEAGYVDELLGAYGEHVGAAIGSVAELDAHASLAEHFGDSRIAFYSAEGLRVFSRDTLPPGSFARLQDDVHAGIKNDVRHPHADGYARVLAATKTAQSLALTAHALGTSATVPDRHGICHQLANDGKVRWTT